ncbi:MAG TPA: hypothetical protein VFW80_03855 [Gaiellaceae bacterium]|nr:hypothetical protein [Gaiellaceae bacterium]
MLAVVMGVVASSSLGGQQGQKWVEQPDAGAKPGGAQAVRGTGQLKVIKGMLVGVDMFKICADPGFSASTIGGADFDSQLFLFDSHGVGLYANDDSGGTLQSELPAGHPNGPSIRGEYFLAISSYDRDPVNGPVPRSPALIFPTFPFDQVHGRFTDTGHVTGWEGVGFGSGAYKISLTGAEFLNRHARCVHEEEMPLGAERIDKG